jgi:MoaA/NifB/PqqE/SkfB family radical SAM enzyme
MPTTVNPFSTHRVIIDEEGHLVFPSEFTERYGLKPGTEICLDEDINGLRLHRPVESLAKIYIEPTNLCNLNCRTCIRNSWDQPLGRMSASTYTKIIDSVQAFSYSLTMFFGGLGEPLFHPDIVNMVARAKAARCRVELITNGTLLSQQMSKDLIKAGLDMLWVSLDGATSESYADIRLGANLPLVLQNIENFRAARRIASNHEIEIGIAFVAMKRNINDLPALLRLRTRLGISRIFISNVLPYTENMCGEAQYSRRVGEVYSRPSSWSPHIDLPRMDTNDTTSDALHALWHGGYRLSFNGDPIDRGMNRCPFITRGTVAIAWDGSLSPCPPLMHDHDSFLDNISHKRPRHSRRYVIGNLTESSLQELWLQPAYLEFRRRVQEFDFSPCSICGGCDLSEANEEDCFGSIFPTCGGCLWAQGVIQCP